MIFGYVRVNEQNWENSEIAKRMKELLGKEGKLFWDIRNKNYDREQYAQMRDMLQVGDVLYVDSLDSLGRTMERMAEEWTYLTQERQLDVVVLENSVQLDSRLFRDLGDTGRMLEQQMLALLVYLAELQHRKVNENQREGIDAAKKAGKRFGRPSLDWDWDLFDATARRWTENEIDLDEACRIVGSARSSWYKYAKERGFVRKRAKK